MNNTLKLKIVTPDGLMLDEDVERIVVRTVNGDVGILPRHVDYVAPLGIGLLKAKINGKDKIGSCNGGTLVVTNNEATIVSHTFEWAENIDVERAKRAEQVAKERLLNKKEKEEIKLAKLKLQRALNRINAYNNK